MSARHIPVSDRERGCRRGAASRRAFSVILSPSLARVAASLFWVGSSSDGGDQGRRISAVPLPEVEWTGRHGWPDVDEVEAQVPPFRIDRLNERNFLAPNPPLDLLISLTC